MTAQSHAHVRFRRAIERRALWLAEDAASELPNLSLEDALQLVHLYAERGSPKFEPAARRWLVRYLSEGTPNLTDVAKVRRVWPSELPPDLAQLASLRRSLADWLARAEVEPSASEAVILATQEAAANAVEHAYAEKTKTE